MGNDPPKPGNNPQQARSEAVTVSGPQPTEGQLGPVAFGNGTIVDRYTILERLGAGGMGEVYAAYDTKLDRKVALKLLLQGGPDYEARLVREAQAMARLSHPNVVGVFDTGRVEAERPDGRGAGRLFLAMEFVQGRTLRAWRKEASRTWEQILATYVEAGRGLAAAHAAGLVHRDFKPDNVLVSTEGQVKVTDFGVVRASEEQPPNAPERVLAKRLASSRPPPAPAKDDLPIDLPSLPAPALTPSLGSLLSQPVTELGTIIGTPGYMAPEQYLCLETDARTDQFSFCAALYESLYDRKPFPGKGMAELAEATVLDRLRPPPKGTNVPARVYKVLARGLANDHLARYPTMQALLQDLARDPAKRRQRVAAGVVVAAAIAGLFVWSHRIATARQGRLCSGADALATEVWSDDVQQQVERAMLATGMPYAADTWARTRLQIDGYMKRWTAAHRQTCEATRVDGSQSEGVMTMRMACLEDRRRGVQALVQVLTNADKDVLAKAHQASLELADLDACKDVTSLSAALPEPAEPAKKAALSTLRGDLATVRAKVGAGKFKDAASQAGSVVEEARTAGYAPLLAEALLLSGNAKIESGAPKDEALSQWAEAVYQADVARDDALRAQAAISLMRRAPAAGKFAEAEQWSKVADAALQRSGENGLVRARWLEARGVVADAQGKYKEAAEYRAQALDSARRVGTDPRLVADIERGLAAERSRLGQVEEASRLIAEADDTIVRVLGDNHPGRIPFLHSRAFVTGGASPRDGIKYETQAITLAEQVAPGFSLVPTMYNNVCSYEADLRQFEEARAACERSIEGARKLWGDDAPILSNAYSGLGNALFGLHRYDDAMAAYKKAMALQEKLGTQHNTNYLDSLRGLGIAHLSAGRAKDAVEVLERAVALAATLEDKQADTQRYVAESRFGLARALWETGVHTPRVTELSHQAEDGYRAIDKKDRAAEVADWRKAKGLS